MTSDVTFLDLSLDSTNQSPIGPDRSATVVEVRKRLDDQNERHVHVYGSPGYGKSDVARALAAEYGKRAVVLQLAGSHAPGESALSRMYRHLAGSSASSTTESVATWQEGWENVAELARSVCVGTPLLIVQSAEHLFTDSASEPWGNTFLSTLGIAVVTLSMVPLHLLCQRMPRSEAERVTITLRSFPSDDAAGYDDELSRADAQAREEYEAEGEAWFNRFMAARPYLETSSDRLRKVFNLKHRVRPEDIWDGHPLLNTLLFERILDATGKGEHWKDAVHKFRRALDQLTGCRSRLRDRLLPFDSDASGSVPASIALAIADAVESLAAGSSINRTSGEWLVAAGLARPSSEGTRWEWTPVATLVTAEPNTVSGRDAMRGWARWLRIQANAYQRRQAELLHRSDAKFRAARDDVARIFCESPPGSHYNARLEDHMCGPVVPSSVYRFAISQDRNALNSHDQKGERRERVIREILVFETEVERGRFWKNHVRTLTMLGRARHPALASFERGGELRDASQAASSPDRAYPVFVEMGEHLDRVRLSDLPQLIAVLQRPSLAEAESVSNFEDEAPGTVTAPAPAFRQVVQLAEALEIVHQQGLLHRALDFEQLAIRRVPNGIPQLVMTGFEYSINIRHELRQKEALPLALLRVNPLKLACRPPESPREDPDIIDPAVDVYSFGAIAIMLMTGLPDQDVLDRVDALLPLDPVHRSRRDGEVEHDGLDKALDLLRTDLLRTDRWEDGSESFWQLGERLRECLDESSKRPAMEDLAPRLRQLYYDYIASFERPGPSFKVSFPEVDMGNMLKRLDLVDEDFDFETPDAQAWLRERIKTWLDSCKWMHYRDEGFVRQGSAEAARTRRDSQFIFAGSSLVFFASPYRPRIDEPVDYRMLWITYAMRRSEIHLPDPDDDDTPSKLATMNTMTWLQKPGAIEVVASANVGRGERGATWRTTLDELKRRGDLKGDARLGREATTVWRVHRDIQLAFDALRNFPVKLQRNRDCGTHVYAMQLDEDAFRRMNEAGPNSFFRQVILERKNVRAFFADTVRAMAEEMTTGGMDLLIYPQSKSQARRHPIRASVVSPVEGETVNIRLDEEASSPVPAHARIVWANTFGTQVAAERQARAITRMELNSRLLNVLVNPRACGRLWRPLSDFCGWTLPRDTDLGGLQRRVRTMLSSDPLHAVQGPPGTGKTSLIAALVAEVVQAQDGGRILVTSQNHAATDNVVLAVMSGLETLSRRRGRDDTEAAVPAIRLFSEITRESVDQDVVRRFSVDSQVQAIQKRMRGSAERQRREAVPGSALSKAVEFLEKVASNGYLELRIKLERTAPVIFSTTGAAMTSVDYLRRGGSGYYDYVLIDEAAKGWAIDLVQAMALADSAILVGDQAQLPPFGEIELDAILHASERRRSDFKVPPDINFLLDGTRHRDTGEAPLARMKGWLKLFHRIFEKCPPDEDGRRTDSNIPLTQKLDRQYRSVPAIGSLVSKVFYQDTVSYAGPNEDCSRRIAIKLRPDGKAFAPAVMWLDTSKEEGTRFDHEQHEGSAISNLGEADLVCQVLRNFQPSEGDSWERLRVLSPYRSQVRELVGRFNTKSDILGVIPEDLSRLFQTVDSSQGSEADIIIISLCRRPSNRRNWDQFRVPKGDSVAAKTEILRKWIRSVLGFLQQPERLNVMSSRARHQLIFIGDINCFKFGGRLMDQLADMESDGSNEKSFWTRLISEFTELKSDEYLQPEWLEKPVIVPIRKTTLEVV